MYKRQGESNNYIFGARVEELEKIMKDYDPRKLVSKNPKIKRVLDTLIDLSLIHIWRQDKNEGYRC